MTAALILTVGGKIAGAITFRETVRPGVAEAVRELGAMGIEVVLASGDSNPAAHKIAEEVGIRRVYAQVVEKDKVRIVRRGDVILQIDGRPVLSVDEMSDAIRNQQTDEPLTILIRRGGLELELELAAAGNEVPR